MTLTDSILFLITYITLLQGTDAASHPLKGPHKICYFINWAFRDSDPLSALSASFTPEHIDFSLCNVIVYTEFSIDNSTFSITSKDPKIDFGTDEADEGSDLISRVITAANATNTPVLASVTGVEGNNGELSFVSTNEKAQDAFVQQAVEFVTKYGFSGITLDYEYPQTVDDGINVCLKPGDDEKVGFSKLIQKLRTEFDKHDFYLAASVGVDIENIDNNYEPKILNDNLDWMELISYDYHSGTESTVGLIAPLIQYGKENATNNVKAAVEAWLSKGVSPSKLVMGIPLYGVSYKLADKTKYTIGSAASGLGLHDGHLYYNQICNLKSQGWTLVHSENGCPIGGSYAYNEIFWVGFDDVTDVEAKAQYIREKQLGGYAAFSLDKDDYAGTKCGAGKYPLLSALSKAVAPAGP